MHLSSPYLWIPLAIAAALLLASGRPPSLAYLTPSSGIYLAAGVIVSVVLHYLWIFGLLSVGGLLAPWVRATIATLLPSLSLSFVFAMHVDLATMGPDDRLSHLALLAPGFVPVRLKARLLERFE